MPWESSLSLEYIHCNSLDCAVQVRQWEMRHFCPVDFSILRRKGGERKMENQTEQQEQCFLHQGVHSEGACTGAWSAAGREAAADAV